MFFKPSSILAIQMWCMSPTSDKLNIRVFSFSQNQWLNNPDMFDIL